MMEDKIYVLADVDSAESKEVDVYCFMPTEGQGLAANQTDDPNLTASGRKRIVLATFDESKVLRETVTQFNQKNQEYEIEVKKYSADNVNAFHLDLVSGNVPDIYFLEQFAPVEIYARKGLYADLYEFLDRDPDIGREDYIETVLQASEVDGKLYAIPESFFVHTLYGRVSDVGTDTGWIWDEFNDLMASKPEGTIPIAGCELTTTKPQITADTFFSEVFGTCWTTFVDFEKMECSFDTPDFIHILEATKRFYPPDAYYEVTPEAFLQGNPVLIRQAGLHSFHPTEIADIETKYFGEEMTLIGYPTMDGTGGSSIESYNMIAISAETDVQEGAWNFLKYILTDYQYDIIDEGLSGFPVKRSALEEFAKKGMKSSQYPPEGYTDPQGVFHRPTLERDVQKIMDLIDSITGVTVHTRSSGGIWGIIYDEIPAYFDGDRTAEDVAANIQNRVSIFLMEME
jgi:ABC-type glycerol-3-phosphate transport system substrate-binding protein